MISERIRISARVIRKAAALTLACLGVLGMAGCAASLDKDEVLEKYNRALQWAGRAALTRDSALEGERSFGSDSYVGTYEAEYGGFSDTEFVFGGTSLMRDTGQTVRVTCRLEAAEGNGCLFYVPGDRDPVVLLDAPGEYEGTLEIPGAGWYLGMAGDALTGSVRLTVEDESPAEE